MRISLGSVSHFLDRRWPQGVPRCTGAARRLRVEALEQRNLLSLASVLDVFKTMAFTSTATYTGTTTNTGYLDNFTGNAVEEGSLAYTSGTAGTGTIHNAASGCNGSGTDTFGSYTFTYTGNAMLADNAGTLSHSEGNSQMSYTPSGRTQGGGNPYEVPLVVSMNISSYPFQTTFSWDTLDNGYHSVGSGSGTITFPSTTGFDVVLDSAQWITGGVEFAFSLPGPVHVAPTEGTPIANIQLFWASGDQLANIMGSALPDQKDLYWNHASGTVQVTNLPTAPPGATHLLVVADYANALTDEASESNNLLALAVQAQPAVAVADFYSTPFNAQLVVPAGQGVLSNDITNPNDQTTAAVKVSDPANGVLDAFNADGSFTYTPSSQFRGVDSFTYKVTDAAGESNIVQVTIRVGLNHDASTPGFMDPSAGFHLRNSLESGNTDDLAFGYGIPGWIPLTGDWDGNGVETVGAYDPTTSLFYLRNSNSTGVADVTFGFGVPGAGWVPIVGDWDGDARDTVGLFAPDTSLFFLTNSTTGGYAEMAFGFGVPGANWTPIAGDWNGNGAASVGLYDPATSMFYLRNLNTTGMADVTFAYGVAGANWKPVVGDWNVDGASSVGLYSSGDSQFYLRNDLSTGFADLYVVYQPTGQTAQWKPLAGDWNGPAPTVPLSAHAVDAVLGGLEAPLPSG